MQKTERICVELAAGLLPDAEKELAAFVHAVQELFGSEQARQSIEDWMEELASMNLPKRHADPTWREITNASAIRLASRVKAPSLRHTTEFPDFVAVPGLVGCDEAF